MTDNPHVTSKGDRHGHPRTPSKVEHIGGTAGVPGKPAEAAAPRIDARDCENHCTDTHEK